ncbi:MAG: hypothetical protein JWP27_2510 [Flaviaesturariibacter sp.]|nr:hypothetical protein [Flaviaesturariibacter sp.]
MGSPEERGRKGSWRQKQVGVLTIHPFLAWQLAVLLLILVAGGSWSVRTARLTPAAAVTGALIGLATWLGAGATGFAMLTAFFVLGTAATKWKGDRKYGAERGERRTTGQVLANGGAAGVLGLCAFWLPAHREPLVLCMAASLASATADTLSSELGTLYGRRFYNILTWRRDRCGLDGVVSLEGILIGIAGSAILALIHAAGSGLGWPFAVIVAAGTAGNLADSVLGAALERKHLLSNNAVNALNTAIAAALAAVMAA